jgi:hypothetical protein
MSNLDDLTRVLGEKGAKRFMQRNAPSSYDEFCESLYADLDTISYEMSEGRKYRGQDSEDRTSIDIVAQLRRLSYCATRESLHGGHVDVVVTKNDFVWLGEAKIYGGPARLFGGFNQLTTRYASGHPNCFRGGMLIYFYEKNVEKKLKDWQQFLKKKVVGVELRDCEKNRAAFFSNHQLDSGYGYEVRHIPFFFHFDPQ